MSGAFFYEHIVDAVYNLQQEKSNSETKSQENSVKKPKKK